ncbi:MAG: 3-methylitaconate isomerase [Thermomicrobiales bacterium]|nr:3-methylitaconate isomerase [Thermomicrobiales bacterium]
MSDRLPCVLMRGGTSKGVFFHDRDLPADRGDRIAALLALLGSPDPGQIDGLGSGTVTTSKVMIIAPSRDPAADVEFTFCQIGTRGATVEFSGTCGNLSAAVAPFAIDEGLVPAVEPVTVVRMLNANTRKLVVAEVPIESGKAATTGAYRIAGVPGTGAEIRLRYFDPAGAITGTLLPTGQPQEVVQLGDRAAVHVSIVDAANPFIFVRAEDVGLTGTERPADLRARPEVLALAEAARGYAAERLGLAEHAADAWRTTPDIPKMAFIAPPKRYVALDGQPIEADDYDVAARMIAIGEAIPAYALSGAICTAVAAQVAGSVVWDAIPADRRGRARVLLAHPSGVMDGEAVVETGPAGGLLVESVSVGRTARRLIAGAAPLPPNWRERGTGATVTVSTRGGD